MRHTIKFSQLHSLSLTTFLRLISCNAVWILLLLTFLTESKLYMPCLKLVFLCWNPDLNSLLWWSTLARNILQFIQFSSNAFKSIEIISNLYIYRPIDTSVNVPALITHFNWSRNVTSQFNMSTRSRLESLVGLLIRYELIIMLTNLLSFLFTNMLFINS